ncbi:MAG: tRNA (guanine(10)-N(2))-dimethyltransferase [Nitrososphaerota archaeon]|nr:tRNA (guanine(10)-N(2))-dimethyltransferase [Aigarchaeota archaeon]MDW8076895.1 tRNA (guanine(10)-N(2))-dimethyltransferase [Nitrososphaerota archaeon]
MDEGIIEFPTRVYEEGKVRFLAPALPEGWEKAVSPSGMPVFFNPHSKLSRDMTVLAVGAYFDRKDIKVCEPLAGCGIRGIRIAVETGLVSKLILNDINTFAYSLIKKNVETAGLADITGVYNMDANALLAAHSSRKLRFDYVDVDPAGSPAPFLENAIRSCRSDGLLGFTATDLAPLCGTNPLSCMRKYDAVPYASPYSKETAARILLGFAARTAARLGMSISPVLTFYRRHYIRAFVRLTYGKTLAKESFRNIGWMYECKSCGSIQWSSYVEPFKLCEACRSVPQVFGPLWLGELTSRDFALKMLGMAREAGMKEAYSLLRKISEELQTIPFYYRVDEIGKRLKSKVPKPANVVDRLRSLGFSASLTHFDGQGFKTNAPREVIEQVFSELVSSEV